MEKMVSSEEYKESRVFMRQPDIFDEIKGNVRIFKKELNKFITEKELMPKFIKYDEQNRT
jgi:hypothetical protein